MASDLDAYQIYCAIKSHFNSPSYDYFKYSGRQKANADSLARRNDRWFFSKIAKRYSKAKLVDFYVANFVADPTSWIGELSDDVEADHIYTEWQNKVESLTYAFSEECNGLFKWLITNKIKFNDLFKVNKADHPIIVKMVLQGVVSLESFIVLDKILGFCKRIDSKIDDIIWNNFFLKKTKYEPFLEINMENCSRILKNLLKDYPEVK